jgi:hypothetical protein
MQFPEHWNTCTTTCEKVPDGSYQWTSVPAATATVTFSGGSIVVFGVMEP